MSRFQTTDPAPGWAWDHVALLRHVFPTAQRLLQALSEIGPTPAPGVVAQWRARGRIAGEWLPSVVLAAVRADQPLPVFAVPSTGMETATEREQSAAAAEEEGA